MQIKRLTTKIDTDHGENIQDHQVYKVARSKNKSRIPDARNVPGR